tara:strand:- start:574 stop:888 length:315 start_codon:yes stop_codon:yes gene_type:complete
MVDFLGEKLLDPINIHSVNQHINTIKLPINDFLTLSIGQYSADTFCEVALFNKKGKPIYLKPKNMAQYENPQRYFHYIGPRGLADIIEAAHDYAKEYTKERDNA